MKITNRTEAKRCIGQRLYWAEPGPKFAMLRSGVLADVRRDELLMEDGDWINMKAISDLTDQQHPEWESEK